MGFWEKIKSIFIKQKQIEKQSDELIYTGSEIKCWACDLPIHETHKRRKLQKGKILHKKCFKQLQKIALNGSSIKEFTGVKK